MLQQYHIPYPQAIVDSINSTHAAQQSTVPGEGTQPDQSSLSGHSTGTMEGSIETFMRYEAGVARWYCLECNNYSNSRKKRIRDHVAHCLGYKLYSCDGSCEVDNWYEPLLFDPIGRFRPAAKDRFVAASSSEPNRTSKIIKNPNGEYARNGITQCLPWQCWIPAHTNYPVARSCVGKTLNATWKMYMAKGREYTLECSFPCIMLPYSTPPFLG